MTIAMIATMTIRRSVVWVDDGDRDHDRARRSRGAPGSPAASGSAQGGPCARSAMTDRARSAASRSLTLGDRLLGDEAVHAGPLL